jgi:hypothetical protein
MYTIELNDTGVLVARDAELVLGSPGYALIDADAIEIGEAAFVQARLHPRRAHNRFWHRLSLDPLTNPSPRYRHQADLAYAHLKHIAVSLDDGAEVMLAVPSNYSREQLALLLGIAQESSLHVVGLVDASVAAVATRSLPENCVYADIQLHQTLAVSLQVSDKIQRQSIEALDRTGLSLLYDKWVHLIADAFIEQCRFDPLHNAETEQALYSRLPQWLAAISQRGEVVLEIESGGKHFQSRLKSAKALETITPIYQRIARMVDSLMNGTRGQLLISHRLAALPGIGTVFGNYRVLPDNAVALGCQANAGFIRGADDGVSFVTALPATQAAAAEDSDSVHSVPVDLAPGHGPVTHLLVNQYAYPLRSTLFLGQQRDSAELCLSYDAHDMDRLLASVVSNGGVQLKCHGDMPLQHNGKSITGSVQLDVSDQLSCEGAAVSVTAISEIDDGAQT